MSVVDNPEKVLDFFEEVDEAKATKLFFNMRNITHIGSDAIALFMAKLTSPAYSRKSIGGNWPEDQELINKLYDSGFLEVIAPSVNIAPTKNAMIIRGSGIGVNPRMAKDITNFVIENVKGYKPREDDLLGYWIYGTINDCMQNTRDHAAAVKNRRGDKTLATDQANQVHWMYNVHIDQARHCACVTFVDLGMGILGSMKYYEPIMMGEYLDEFRRDHTILHKIMLGEKPSRTGNSRRGQGLPNLYSTYLNGYISKLVIMSNKAYLDFDRGQIRALNPAFNGTFIYWELVL